MTAALEGVRVLEVAGWMAAPGAAAIMADLGADVIKLEPLGGDAMRGITRLPERPPGEPPLDASFQMDNRGKRGIAVALNKPEGQDLVRRLVAHSDVFLNNLLAKRQQRYGLDSQTLLGVNPRLVHASLTGYGLEGPDAGRPGYDITAFFGRGAITHMGLEPGSLPARARPAQGDHAASLAMLASILAALRLVERTGEGQVIDVNLLSTAAWTMATDLSGTLVDGQNPPMLGRRGRYHALQGSFATQDHRFLLLFMPEPHWWPRFCAAVGKPEWVDDPDLATYAARREHMDHVTDLLDDLFTSRDLRDWAQLLDEHGFIWAPAATVAEFAADEQARELDLFPEVEHPEAGRFRTVAAPLGLRGADVRPRGPAPEIGQHTGEVLREVGVSDAELAALAEAGVVGGLSQG